MTKLVRLADIAKAVGVSTVTVSNALAGKKGVSEELRRQIDDQAERMGYVKSKSVGKLENECYRIGVLISERYLGGTTSFYWELYQKIANIASKKSSVTILEVVSLQKEQIREPGSILQQDSIDGLIVIGRMDKAYLQQMKQYCHVPFIFLDFYDSDIICDCVVSENYYGMYQMTKYLIEQGHTKIAFLGSILATGSIMDRYLGYCKAMLENQIEVKKEWILPDRNIETGKMYIELPKTMPTAIVCNCDLAAERLIDRLEEQGYQVPKDLSVVGYDNFTYSPHIKKVLTTYDVDTNRLAKECLHTLMKKITMPSTHVGVHMVKGTMLIRNSVKQISKLPDCRSSQAAKL